MRPSRLPGVRADRPATEHARRRFRRRPEYRGSDLFHAGVWWRRLANDAARLMGGGWRDKPGHVRPGQPSSRSPIRVGLAGPGSLDGSTQTLPSLYAAPSSDFNTVAAASSSFGGGGGFGYGYGYGAFWSSSLFGDSGLGASATTSSSSTGANTATGLGTPIGPALVRDLVASTLTTPLTPVTGSGGGTTSPTPTPPTNPVGGGSGHHHRPTHSGSRTVKSGKTHAEAPARSRHVKQGSVPKKLSTDRSLRD